MFSNFLVAVSRDAKCLAFMSLGPHDDCLISYRAEAWHYRIFPDFLKSPVSKWWIVRG